MASYHTTTSGDNNKMSRAALKGASGGGKKKGLKKAWFEITQRDSGGRLKRIRVANRLAGKRFHSKPEATKILLADLVVEKA